MHHSESVPNQGRSLKLAGGGALAIAVAVAAIGVCRAGEYLSGIEWKKPPVVTPGKAPGDAPSDAVVLFDGKDLSAWNGADGWKVEDGVAIVGSGMIESKQAFGDSQIHIEWSAPTPAAGTGQGRGNSGVYLGNYELQVLDSYQDETYYDGQAAAIYKQRPPMVNAMRPPGEWNAYDILWTAPRFKDDGSLASPAFITVLHNGVVVHNHYELAGDTPFNRPPQYTPHPVEMPIKLQDHGNPVRYRNIWVREIKPLEGKQTRGAFLKDGETETPIETATGKVSGEISLNGEPVSAGQVTLYSHGAGQSASGDVTDGRFMIDAVTPGTYIITLDAETTEGDARKAPSKFSDRDKSPITVQVRTGENTFNFELTSK